jgi:hypothetical protein
MRQDKCWAAQSIGKVFHLDVSFTFWFMVSGPFAIFSEVSSVSNTDPHGPENCGSGAFIAKEFDGVGYKGSRVTTLDVEKTLGVFLEDFQACDHVP